MTATELFDSTNDVYLSLIHPEIDDLLQSDEFALLLKQADSADEQIVEELIRSSDWRERIVGFAMAARKRLWSLGAAASQSLLDPRGIAVVPAGAFLITCGHVGNVPSDILIPNSFDHEIFDGEIGFVLDCVSKSLSRPRMSVPSALGPNYGQDIHTHTKLHVMLPAIGNCH